MKVSSSYICNVHVIIKSLSVFKILDFDLQHDNFLILSRMIEAFNDYFSDVHFPMCVQNLDNGSYSKLSQHKIAFVHTDNFEELIIIEAF